MLKNLTESSELYQKEQLAKHLEDKYGHKHFYDLSGNSKTGFKICCLLLQSLSINLIFLVIFFYNMFHDHASDYLLLKKFKQIFLLHFCVWFFEKILEQLKLVGNVYLQIKTQKFFLDTYGTYIIQRNLERLFIIFEMQPIKQW